MPQRAQINPDDEPMPEELQPEHWRSKWADEFAKRGQETAALERQIAQLAGVLLQCRDALAQVDGNARTAQVVNAYCRADMAINALQPHAL